MKIISVVGARPNFVKIMPIIQALKARGIQNLLVHTGQHYDYAMAGVFFKDLNIPRPDIYLNVGSDTHARQTAKIMVEFEAVLLRVKPNLVIAVGDVNSTLACALTAVKLHIPVAHVEAGLRSFDMKMPEEINRIVTDRISSCLFTPSSDANENLRKEGVASSKIFLVGNVMIDTLIRSKPKAGKLKTYKALGLVKGNYAFLTLHRPENVDDRKYLTDIVSSIKEISRFLPIVFPIHPRTKKNIKKFRLQGYLKNSNIRCIEPLGYLDCLNLLMYAKLVLTDSGGIQEETSVLDIPCLTLRENTERPITVAKGTNIVVGRDKETIIKAANRILKGTQKQKKDIAFWDGHAAGRIVDILKNFLTSNFERISLRS
ncbi:MAG: UDP-N-acetylglucosamine 2-epimerase (non-hydrolyzing) [Candidatus Omnitrophica bacterium]|nr:UDP-N-acetylglucosamine 2-epimerase (non-hydrolyzing) [Candidatus Omnitrophota bacterium]